MARGWESKSIEAQQEEASRRPIGKTRSPAEAARADRRRALELTRARAAEELARASAQAHRQMLEHALNALDAQLAAFDESPTE